jgi:hypothetical protein
VVVVVVVVVVVGVLHGGAGHDAMDRFDGIDTKGMQLLGRVPCAARRSSGRISVHVRIVQVQMCVFGKPNCLLLLDDDDGMLSYGISYGTNGPFSLLAARGGRISTFVKDQTVVFVTAVAAAAVTVQ